MSSAAGRTPRHRIVVRRKSTLALAHALSTVGAPAYTADTVDGNDQAIRQLVVSKRKISRDLRQLVHCDSNAYVSRLSLTLHYALAQRNNECSKPVFIARSLDFVSEVILHEYLEGI